MEETEQAKISAKKQPEPSSDIALTGAVENGDTLLSTAPELSNKSKKSRAERREEDIDPDLQAEIDQALNGEGAYSSGENGLALFSDPDSDELGSAETAENEPGTNESAEDEFVGDESADEKSVEEPEEGEIVEQEAGGEVPAESTRPKKKKRKHKSIHTPVSARSDAEAARQGEVAAVDESTEPAYPDFFQCYPLPPGASLRDFEVRKLLIGLYTGRGGLTNYFI